MFINGFWSALMLKPIAAMIGIAYLVVLVRAASTESYAVYVAAWAIIEIATLVSNAGSLPAAYRYVNRASGTEYSPSGPVAQILLIRAVTLIGAVPFIFAILQLQQSSRSLAALLIVFPIFAAIIFAEGMARMTDVMLESCLAQKRVQLSQMLRISLKLIPMLYFAHEGDVTIPQIFVAEAIGVGAGLLTSAGSLGTLYWKKTRLDDEKVEFQTIIRYALPAYLTQFANVFCSIEAFKIALSKYADPVVLATFGFAHSVSGIVQRYMPVNMLSGFMRPLFIHSARINDGLASLNTCNNLWSKLNMIIVSIALIGFCYNGTWIIQMIEGKYIDSVFVITVLLASFLVSSLRLCLANFCLSIEYPRPPLFSEIACIPSLLLIAPMSQAWGALGVAVVVLLNEFIWLSVCLFSLKRAANISLAIDWLGIGKIGVLVFCVCALAFILAFGSFASISASTIALIVFAGGIWLTSAFREDERLAMLALVPRRGSSQA
jgi:O-antigen/teichoic acid export membrane protein